MKRPNPETVQKESASKSTTDFGPPIVAAGITDPAAHSYARSIQERRGPPKFSPPVAGGPTANIPRLDAPAAEGLTMADQGVQQRAAASPPTLGMPQGGMFQGGFDIPRASPPQPQQPAGLAQPAGILPTDTLPPEATHDPAFRQGQGSLYATSQPELAYKYGVIRGNQRVAPQMLTQQRTQGLSQGTIADLQRIQELQRQQAPGAPHPLMDSPEQQAARESAASPAGAAARLAGGTDTGPKMTEEEAREAARKLDDFDFNALRERMMKDMLNNEEQKKLIEDRLEPLAIDDLIMKGYVAQRVPIIPGKFEPTFRSMSAEEDLAIKRLIMLESKQLEVSDRYILDKFALMSVVLGVIAINSNPLPDYKDADGRFNDVKFWEKFNFLTRNSFHMLASLGVNYYWFDIRVRGLFVAKNLGNG